MISESLNLFLSLKRKSLQKIFQKVSLYLRMRDRPTTHPSSSNFVLKNSKPMTVCSFQDIHGQLTRKKIIHDLNKRNNNSNAGI